MVAGYPSLEATRRAFFDMERAGADLIELGIPFSDPMADGPVIQRASEAALKKGITLGKVLRLVRTLRERSETPVILMGYYNPILAFGLRRFAKEAAKAGVDGTIVVDLPPEESAPLDRELKRRGIDLIGLLTPTSDPKRIAKVVKRGRGFIYYVSMTGITGGRLKGSEGIRRSLLQIRKRTKLPILVGFGIRTPREAKEVARWSDGVVVGSEIIRRGRGSNRFLRAVRSALSK